MLQMNKSATHSFVPSDILWDNETQYRKFFDKQPIAAIIGDFENNLGYRNKLFLNLVGYSVEETPDLESLLKAAFTDGVYRQKVRSIWLQNLDQAKKDGKDLESAEFEVFCKDGQKRIFNIWGTLLDGKVLYLLNDVTDNKKTEDQLKLEATRSKTMTRIAAQLNSELELDAVLQYICKKAAAIMDVPAANIFLYDETHQTLNFTISYGFPIDLGRRIKPISRTNIEEWFNNQNTLIVPNIQDFPETSNSALYHELGIISLVEVLMIHKDAIIGALQILTLNKERDFSADDIQIIKGYSDLAAQAIVNANLYNEVKNGRERLRHLSQQLVDAQEAERRRLARELHDEIGQYLTGLNYTLETINRSAPEKVHDGVKVAQDILNMLLPMIRDMSLNLRPATLDDFGLLPTFQDLFVNYTKVTQILVKFKHTGIKKVRFDQSIETTVYRIIQEAISNIARHAQVNQALVQIDFNGNIIHIEVKDHGKGFNLDEILADDKNVGLASMSERIALINGIIQIQSIMGKGTSVIVDIPTQAKGQE